MYAEESDGGFSHLGGMYSVFSRTHFNLLLSARTWQKPLRKRAFSNHMGHSCLYIHFPLACST